MKTTNTTPEQILEVWEKAYIRLNAEGRKEFKKHKVTKQLCEKRLVDIKAAIFQGKKQYLPEILDYLKKVQVEQNIRSQEDKGQVVYVDPQLWAGNYTSNLEKTSTYNCSVCESPVIGLKCRCAVAA
jgi:hypothetical protein